MAHEVKILSGITIHQALHGYAEGHREIAASLKLKPRDAKTMLVLSDIASSGLRIGTDGYLTGYPLAESGYYALARTWPATEISRPGAVWTHTLLVEFSDLAIIRNARVLLSQFSRPAVDSTPLATASYEAPLEVQLSKTEDPSHQAPLGWFRQLVSSLYGSPTSKIIATTPGEWEGELEAAVLAIWSQQWPRLRRAFRFCTLTSADRSSEKSLFDLQVVPDSERGFKSRFPEAVYANDAPDSGAEWVDHVLDDLTHPQAAGLRDFFQKVGSDVASGRSAFVPLVRLHMMLADSAIEPSSLADAVKLLGSEFVSSASAAKQLIARSASRAAPAIDPAALDFLLQNLALLTSEELNERAAAIGTALWRRAPSELTELLHGDPSRKQIAESTIASLATPELLKGLQQVTSTALDVSE